MFRAVVGVAERSESKINIIAGGDVTFAISLAPTGVVVWNRAFRESPLQSVGAGFLSIET